MKKGSKKPITVGELVDELNLIRHILAQKEITLNMVMSELGYEEDFIVDVNKPVKDFKEIFDKFQSRKSRKLLEV